MLTVAEHWLNSATDKRQSDCQAFGITQQKEGEHKEGDKRYIFASNIKALRVFFACMTQWNYGQNSAIPTGLNYPSVHACANLLGQSLTPSDFTRIRILERFVLEKYHDIKSL